MICFVSVDHSLILLIFHITHTDKISSDMWLMFCQQKHLQALKVGQHGHQTIILSIKRCMYYIISTI